MKTVLITGVSSGIGFELSKSLIQTGFRVIGTVRNEADLSMAEATFGPSFKGILVDVTKPADIENMVQFLNDDLKSARLFALINNSGIAVGGPLEHIDIEDFKHQMDVNVFGVLRITQSVLPILRQFNSSEKTYIINIGSVSGLVASPFMGAYCSSKFALEAFSDVLRRELALWNISVHLIQPGPIKTLIWEKNKTVADTFAHTIYAPYLEKASRVIEKTAAQALEPHRVTDVVVDILKGRSNKTRYLIHKNAYLIKLFAHILPDKVLDYFMIKNLKSVDKFRPF